MYTNCIIQYFVQTNQIFTNFLLCAHKLCNISNKANNNSVHSHHDKPVTDHMNTPYSKLNEEQKKTLTTLVSSYGSVPIIKTYMHQQHHVLVNDSAITQARHDFTMASFREIGIDPSDSACDRLLSFFRIRDDISFVAVTHCIKSGYVTMRKGCNGASSEVTSEETSDCIHNDEIESWRNTLKVDKGKKILVALAWSHYSNYRNVGMYPEMLSVDVTFGVCREQRNLLRVVSIDGNMKVYEVMNCFMPSKQFKAYNWAMNVALPKLIGPEILKFTTLITSDQEENLIRSIRSLIERNKIGNALNGCINAAHRLDMYHIFIKEWKNKASLMYRINLCAQNQYICNLLVQYTKLTKSLILYFVVTNYRWSPWL